MSNKLHIYAFLALFMSASLGMMAEEIYAASEPEVTTVNIAINGNKVHISGAEGKTLYIYDLAGVKIDTIKIESDSQTIKLEYRKGCYILKVGDVARKVSVL